MEAEISNLVLNWRFGSYHFQIVRFGDWRWMIAARRSPVTLSRNPYHDLARKTDPDWRWFERC